ncbi:MAG: hypothetical protein RL654_859 [Pseudomonadota bacterium]|jgi:hypothetical protein
MKSAVLLVVFNRPEKTRRVFEAVRRARPPRLYVAADGPRNPGEARLCSEVRAIVSEVDWPCEVRTLFRDVNVGCRDGVADAISWMLSQEPFGIILEDDCLPSSSFFAYCDLMDQHHREDARIYAISGTNFDSADGPGQLREGYFFSKYSLMWGWATWADRWSRYEKFPKPRDVLAGIFLRNRSLSLVARLYWCHVILKAALGIKKTAWDYQWIFQVLKDNALVCRPPLNLVHNIGFDEAGTNTKAHDSVISNNPAHEIDVARLRRNVDFVIDRRNDEVDECVWVNLSLKGRLRKHFSGVARLVSG